MIIRFRETFALPADLVYGYFHSPADWVRLYGFAGRVEDRGDGWHAVPLKGFPFPLVARMTIQDAPRHAAWRFRGFWRGDGEVRIGTTPAGITVEGYEDIAVRWLGPLSGLAERAFLERQFRRIWQRGWKRLRQLEAATLPPGVTAPPPGI